MNHNQKLAYYYTILALCSSSFIALISLLLIFLCKNKNNPHRKLSGQTPPPPPPTPKPSAQSYSLIDIHTATEGFTHRRLIGEGRLGTVYAAVSETGKLLAVKRIHPWLVLSSSNNNNNAAGFKFSSVMKSISSAQHPNLVSITGYSEAPGERIVVSEYAGGENLNFYINQNPLNWSNRVKIAAGVARGIQYLHESMTPSVIHGCLKPSNIVIDEKLNPKLSDFGMGMFGERRGVIGYVDEETRNWNCKENDVFGLGVVILEIMSGRSCEEGRLVKWAVPLLKEMKIFEVLDSRIECPFEMSAFVRLGKVVLACVGNCRKSRPVIGQVVAILNNLEIEVCV